MAVQWIARKKCDVPHTAAGAATAQTALPAGRGQPDHHQAGAGDSGLDQVR